MKFLSPVRTVLLLMLIVEINFFPSTLIAQEEDQGPTEDIIQTEATRQPVKRIVRKRRKVSKPSAPKPAPPIVLPAPPRTPRSVAPISYTVFRFSQYSGDINVGQYFMQTALNTPGSTYLLGTVALNSGNTNSTRPTNLQSFSSSLIFDGPHWNGLGLSATFNSAGAETDTGRAGLYYRMIGRVGEFGYLIVPHLLFNKSTPEIGRLLVVYNMSVLGDLLVISGSTSYTWDHEVEPMRYTVTLDPAFELKIYSTIRFVVSHSYSQSNGTERNATGFGLEFRQVF